MNLIPSKSRVQGFLMFLALFLSIVVLFFLLSYYLPSQQVGGWGAIVLFLFLYFVGEPVYRQLTDRWEIHVLVLEIYVFTAFWIQLFFPQSPFAYLFYVIPVFSGALSFGLLGTMLTSLAIFFLEMLRFSVPLWSTGADMSAVLMNTLPIFILALLLGFTVELKNRIQNKLLDRLSKMDVLRSLKEIFEPAGTQLTFDDKFLRQIVDLIDISGAFLLNADSDTVVSSVGISSREINQCLDESPMVPNVVHRLELPWDGTRYQLVMLGKERRGVLQNAEREMIEALGIYIKHLIDHYRLQRESIRENEYRRAIFNAVPTGILICDADGDILEVNDTAMELLRGGTVSDSNIETIFFSDGEPVELQPDRLEVQLQPISGEESIPADLAIEEIPVGDSSADPRWILVFSDLRPVKELEREAARKRRLVALGELGAGLAHEIRNPLGSLSGFVSLLDEKTDDVDALPDGLIENIRDSYNRIDDLISQFVHYAREPEPYQGQFDLGSVVTNEIDRMDFPDDINVNFVEPPPEKSITVSGDRNRCELVVRNILRNARKAVDENGTISVTINPIDSFHQLVVEDDGIGIEADHLDRVFDPFVSYSEGGLGLGLSTAHRIMTDEFDGGIDISSVPGEGTTVQLEFPRVSGDRESKEEAD